MCAETATQLMTKSWKRATVIFCTAIQKVNLIRFFSSLTKIFKSVIEMLVEFFLLLPESSLTPIFMPFSWCFSSSQKKKKQERKERTHTPFQLYRIKRSSVLYHVVQAKNNDSGQWIRKSQENKKKYNEKYFFSVQQLKFIMMITIKWSKNIQIALLLSMLMLLLKLMMMVCINLKRNFRNKLVHHQFLMTLNSAPAFDKVHWISK